jgi:hypothetical protein
LESPASFVNAMEGAAEMRREAYDLALAQAWHTEAFAREKRLKKLSDYQGKKSGKRSVAADAVAFFHSLKARGVPVEIRRVVH